MTTLTKTQKLLIAEIRQIMELINLDYENIESYDKEARTPILRRQKDQMIRGQVIIQYTLIDEFLSNKLAHYFFPKNKSFIYLWKTKKFQNFNYYFLQELSLLQKLRFVKSIVHIPRKINRDIENMNALRNALAHALFPENLKKSKPQWKGGNIFSLDGLKLFMEDMEEINRYFWGIKAW
jgi:hypothetical protein